jgi:alanine transaminase
MGNPSVTFIRQVLALITYPDLLRSFDFPDDAKLRADQIPQGSKGRCVSSYSDSPGIEIIRRHVAAYIERRDGGIRAD